MLTAPISPAIGAGFKIACDVVMSVLDHARSDPAAAKAIYDHVFVPIFVRKPDSKPERKLVANAKPVVAVTEPSEPEWKG